MGECGGEALIDCDGNCIESNWVGVGNGWCDSGYYGYGNLNCEEFDCDGGDCPSDSEGNCLECYVYDCYGVCDADITNDAILV